MQILNLLEKFKIQNYFFLDTTLPTLVKFTQNIGNKNFAVRWSRYEGTENIEMFKGRADWIWVDCFNAEPMDSREALALKKNFRICMVSPELHGFVLRENIEKFSSLAQIADTICTKDTSSWEVFLKNHKSIDNLEHKP